MEKAIRSKILALKDSPSFLMLLCPFLEESLNLIKIIADREKEKRMTERMRGHLSLTERVSNFNAFYPEWYLGFPSWSYMSSILN